MASSYPSTSDTFPAVSSTTPTNDTNGRHSNLHNNISSGLMAVQRKLGYSSATSGVAVAPSTNVGDVLAVSDTNGRTSWGPKAMVLLTRTVLGSSATFVDFVSLPQTYAALRVAAVTRNDDPSSLIELRVQCSTVSSTVASPDTGGNYAYQQIFARGTVVTAGAAQGTTYITAGHMPGATYPSTRNNGVTDMTIENYASTRAWYRNILSVSSVVTSTLSGATSMFNESMVNAWYNDGPLYQIRLFPSVGAFAAGSEFNVWGIPSAT